MSRVELRLFAGYNGLMPGEGGVSIEDLGVNVAPPKRVVRVVSETPKSVLNLNPEIKAPIPPETPRPTENPHAQRVEAANQAAARVTPEESRQSLLDAQARGMQEELADPDLSPETRERVQRRLAFTLDLMDQLGGAAAQTPEARAAVASSQQESQSGLVRLLERQGIQDPAQAAAEVTLANQEQSSRVKPEGLVDLGVSPDVPSGRTPDQIREWVGNFLDAIEATERHLEAHDLRFIGDLKTTVRVQVPDRALATELEEMVNYRISLHEAYVALHISGDMETWAREFGNLSPSLSGSPGMAAIYGMKGVPEAMKLMEGDFQDPMALPGTIDPNVATIVDAKTHALEEGAFFRIKGEHELQAARRYLLGRLPPSLTPQEKEVALRETERLLRVTGQASVYNCPEDTSGNLIKIPPGESDKWEAIYTGDPELWEIANGWPPRHQRKRSWSPPSVLPPMPDLYWPPTSADYDRKTPKRRYDPNLFIVRSGDKALQDLYYYPQSSAFSNRQKESPTLRRYSNLRVSDFLSSISRDTQAVIDAYHLGITVTKLSDVLETRTDPQGRTFRLIDYVDVPTNLKGGYIGGVVKAEKNKGNMDTFLSTPVSDAMGILMAGQLTDAGGLDQNKITGAVAKGLENFSKLTSLYSGTSADNQRSMAVRLRGLITLMKDHKQEADDVTGTHWGGITARTAVNLSERLRLVTEDGAEPMKKKTQSGTYLAWTYTLLEGLKSLGDLILKVQKGR